MSGLVDVALPLPFQAPFTYRLPAGEASAERGVRVLVPFGSRRVIGVVTGPARPRAGLALKDVVQVLDESPLVPPPLLDLAAWIADHYLAPPGECYRLLLPPAGVRASKAVVRSLRSESAGDDPILEWIRERPLPVSTLARRLGRDPAARLSRLRRDGLVEIDQDLHGPGFRELQVAVMVDGDPKGKAQAEVVERLRGAHGRARVADLVRDRPSLRAAVMRLAEQGVRPAGDGARRPHPQGPARGRSRPLSFRPRTRSVCSPPCGKQFAPAASSPSSCTGSRAAARPRSTSARWRRRSSAGGERSCSSPRSRSRPC